MPQVGVGEKNRPPRFTACRQSHIVDERILDRIDPADALKRSCGASTRYRRRPRPPRDRASLTLAKGYSIWKK